MLSLVQGIWEIGGPLDEIVTVSVHKVNVIMECHNDVVYNDRTLATSFSQVFPL